MQECYDQLDEDDSEFLGNRFPGKDGESNAFGSEIDSDSSGEFQIDKICDVELSNGEKKNIFKLIKF